jgi:DNA polymerase III gamma/tau subunit
LKYIICLGEHAKSTIAYFQYLVDEIGKFRYFFIWHPSYISRNNWSQPILDKYKTKLLIIKEVLKMSKQIKGVDAVAGKIYASPKGTVVKITKREEKGGKTEVYGLTHPSGALITVPHEMQLTEVEDSKKYTFGDVKVEKEEKKEAKVEKEENEEKKEAKVEKEEKEEKKEAKVEKEEKEEKEEKPKKEKKEKKEGDEDKKRKSKIDPKEMTALYDGIKAHLGKGSIPFKENKNYIVFKIDDIKCRLYKYDCMVLAEKKVKDVEPMKKFEDYVKYPVQDLFKVIGYKG